MNPRYPLTAGLLGLLLPLAALAQAAPAQAAPAQDASAQDAPTRDRPVNDAAAPAAPAPWTPATGDAVVDARLVDINRYASRYPDAFVDELVRYFDAPRPLLEELLGRRGRMAGDLYYACALARVSGRPCRGVIEAWSAGHPDGWEGIARGFGVEPGSARARRLRDGMADSYRRWGRPLPADD